MLSAPYNSSKVAIYLTLELEWTTDCLEWMSSVFVAMACSLEAKAKSSSCLSKLAPMAWNLPKCTPYANWLHLLLLLFPLPLPYARVLNNPSYFNKNTNCYSVTFYTTTSTIYKTLINFLAASIGVSTAKNVNSSVSLSSAFILCSNT